MKCLSGNREGWSCMKYENQKHLLRYSLSEQLTHGMQVSNLAYEVAKGIGFEEEECHNLAVAGMLHDIGKVTLMNAPELENHPLVVEELKYVRMHPQTGYKILKSQGYADDICQSVLYHHENFDGSGYPYNLEGRNIPRGARILRICDVFCALISDRPYRSAFSPEAAVELMIDEIKNYDMRFFLAFQRVIHNNPDRKVKLPEITLDVRGELREL